MQELSNFVSGNWELFLALTIILFLLARTWYGPSAVVMVLANEAVQLINHKDALVVDVRTEKEYKEGHVMNALHIPLGKLDAHIQELQAYKNSAIVMVCRSGARSAQAATKLKKLGFTDVHNIGGGMLAWARDNLPTTTNVGKPPKPNKPEPENVESGDDSEAKKTVLVYSTDECSSCVRVIELLKAKDVDFDEIRIDQDADKRKEMETRSGQMSAPQIFIDDFHVGGCDEMCALEDKGELDAMLGLQDVSTEDSKQQGFVA